MEGGHSLVYPFKDGRLWTALMISSCLEKDSEGSAGSKSTRMTSCKDVVV